jgi:cellulose synthase/poly-beta-1,6-N-acetylglucosamine synthase-like glycosyltransferase
VQIPLYNERYVAERAVLAAGNLDYPPSKLEIQVLDDSTDETSIHVARAVSRLRANGINAAHIRRANRAGYKAGALAAGLDQATGEFIAIFDADFVPEADFLQRVIVEFADPGVGMVQARWGYLNESSSLLTRAQALQLDAHFTTEHGVRAASGCFFNFNGTAGVWRRDTIDDAGGWAADTLTEDLDLSFRAQLRGWRFIYRDDVEVPSELPAEVAAYRLQQQRWAQGGIQTATKLLPRILKADLPTRVKRGAVWHLLIHLSYPMLVVVTLAGLAVGFLTNALALRWVLAVDGLLLTMAMASLTYFYGVTARARGGRGWARRLALVPVIMVLGAGISLGQTAAVIRGMRGVKSPFRRTPKYRLAGPTDRSWRTRSYRVTRRWAALAECGIGASVIAAGVGEAIVNQVPPSGLVLLFGIGLIVIGAASLTQQRGGPVRIVDAT